MLISDFFTNEERPFQTNDLWEGPMTLLIKTGEKRKNPSRFRNDGRLVPAIIFEDDKRFVLLRTVKQMTEARISFGNDMTMWTGQKCRLSLAPWTSPEGTEEYYIKVEKVEDPPKPIQQIELGDDTYFRRSHLCRKPKRKT